MRYIVTTYPVVILFLSGTLSNYDSPESYIYTFEGTVQWHFYLTEEKHFLWFDFLCSYTCLISSSLLSCNPCYFLHHICGTHCYDHMEAPQTSSLQRQWTQSVTSWNCPQSKETLSMNLILQRFLYFLVGNDIDLKCIVVVLPKRLISRIINKKCGHISQGVSKSKCTLVSLSKTILALRYYMVWK